MARYNVCPRSKRIVLPPGLDIRWRKGALPGRAMDDDDRGWWTAEVGDLIAEVWPIDRELNVWGIEVDWMPFRRFRGVSLTSVDSAMVCAERAIVAMFWQSLWEQKRTVADTGKTVKLHGGRLRRDAYRLASAHGA